MTISPWDKSSLGNTENLRLFLDHVIILLSKDSIEVSTLLIDFPSISDTFAINPTPSVPLLSKLIISSTLQFSPEFIISIPLIEPETTDSILISCSSKSFVPIIKSLFALLSDTLYGKVFLR